MDHDELSGMYEARHRAVEAATREAGLDAIVVVADWRQKGNLRYLGGRVIWSRWCYIILKDGVEPTMIMIAPSQRFWAKREGSISDVRFSHHPEQEVVEVLRELCPNGGMVGMAGMKDTIRVDSLEYIRKGLPGVEFEEASPIVEAIRMKKTPHEILGLRNSMRIAEEGFELFEDMLRPGVSHWEIVGEVERILRGQGCYDTMILLSAGPYLREPGTAEFRGGDFVMFSIELAGPEGYWVERGGMFSLGTPSDTAVRLHELCVRALEETAQLLTPGRAAADIARNVETILLDGGFDLGIWGGHGIGLDVVEPPILLPDEEQLLQAGTAIGFHPHVVDHDTGLGGYVSDVFLVADGGGEALSHSGHALRVVDQT